MRISLAAFSIFTLLSQSALMLPSPARSAELPEFGNSYCLQLTSRMLNEGEKSVETNKCLDSERGARKRLIDHWAIVSEKTFGYCRTLSPGSYEALERCLAAKTGYQCFSGELRCD
jgi:hypothetical protein